MKKRIKFVLFLIPVCVCLLTVRPMFSFLGKSPPEGWGFTPEPGVVLFTPSQPAWCPLTLSTTITALPLIGPAAWLLLSAHRTAPTQAPCV